jgi:hypothetical protein
MHGNLGQICYTMILMTVKHAGHFRAIFTFWIAPLAMASLTRASSYVKPTFPVTWQLQALFRYSDSFLQ